MVEVAQDRRRCAPDEVGTAIRRLPGHGKKGALDGLALLLPSRQRVLAWLMPALALVHGWAHGVEAAPDAFWQFTAGFVMASAALLAVGFGAGALLRRHQRVRQLAGGGLVAAAAVLFAG